MRWFQIFHINYKPPHFVIKEFHYLHLNNNFPSLSIQNGNVISHKQSLWKHFPMSQNVPSLLSEVSVSLWMLKLDRGVYMGELSMRTLFKAVIFLPFSLKMNVFWTIMPICLHSREWVPDSFKFVLLSLPLT